MHRILQMDRVFRDLDIPLQPVQYRELEKRIQKNESAASFPIWQGYLLMGYDKYNLMIKYHRHFTCLEKQFARKTDAVAWICREQLKRTDLTKPATYWLLYRLYDALLDAEKRIQAKEQFQYKKLSPSCRNERPREMLRENTAVMKMVGGEFHYDKLTIRNYVQFGRQLDRLNDMFPGIRDRVLKGDVEIALIYMNALMDMPPEELQKMISDPQCKKLRPPEHITREILQHREAKQKRRVHVETAIKKIPAYDPDAELNGLAYTIGAWTKVIKRTNDNADFHNATKQGKENLHRVLKALVIDIDSLNNKLEETEHE